MVIIMTTKIKKSKFDFKYRNRGSIWENRVEYFPHGRMNFVRKDVTSHIGKRYECDNIFTVEDIRHAIRDNRLPLAQGFLRG